jgi:cell division protein FtsB
MGARASRRRRRTLLSGLARRWVVIVVAGVIALLYSRPLAAYWHTRGTVAQRSAQVRALGAEKQRLERRLEASATDNELAREARRLGLVKPGERLYIVKGIAEWRRAHRATIRGGG